MNRLKLQQMLHAFFLEDIGDRDLTSESIFTSADMTTAYFLAKEDGIISGMDVIKEGYQILDPSIQYIPHVKDGSYVTRGSVIATIKGSTISILTGERVILNIIQRMSGISTLTHQAIQLLNSSFTRICDTRKTTPGLRMLEKYAVVQGGGFNHRIGLYDAIMIKDNHIDSCGSITKAVNQVRSKTGHMVKIEVETENIEQVLEAVEAKADVIMFDNRTPDEIKQFVQHVPIHITTEASGGITLENLPQYRDTKVNYISLGYLTHSVKALDISLTTKI